MPRRAEGFSGVGLSSARLLYLVSTLFCIVVAFLPRSDAARWLDLAIAPTRVLGELAAPIGMLARREVRAAERALAASVEREHAESLALADDERMFALPDEERLIGSRKFAHAQVLHRSNDEIECELEQQAGPDTVVDLPVVFSNSFVGRVVRVDHKRGRIRVMLATDPKFRVGASVDAPDPKAPPVSIVVGGLESTYGKSTPLSVHNPERTDLAEGLVRVDERLNPQVPFRALSEGFQLGRLSRQPSGRLAVMPEMDFRSGLFRVVVVLPPTAGERTPARSTDVFAPVHWRAVRAYAACEPAAWREGLKIDYPLGTGALEGSAVVAGARLIGRVSRAGALHSDVALLGDRGLSVQVLAKIDGEVAPLALGRLVALGREQRAGAAHFQWSPVKGLEPGDDGAQQRAATLFSGAGELGVPRGLLIGRTLLPCGPGPHVLEVEQGLDTRLLHDLRVWRGRESLDAGGGGQP